MTTNEMDSKTRLTIPVEESEESLCRVIWLSVILQMLSDALSQSDHYPFNKRREEALKWFEAEQDEGSDFAMVCNLAGVDFSLTKKRMNMFINKEIHTIDFRCLHKGKSNAPTESRKTFLHRMKEKDIRNRTRLPLKVTPSTFRKTPLETGPANSNYNGDATAEAAA